MCYVLALCVVLVLIYGGEGCRTARNAKPIEVIGTYDPIPKVRGGGSERPVKDISLDQVRARYWLGVGAQPSEPMWRLLAMVCPHRA